MRALLLAVLLAVGTPAVRAQNADPLQAFGGLPGLNALMLDFHARLKADARIGHFFKDVKGPPFAEALAEQACQELGGPCQYKGAPMKLLHQEFEIRASDFNALVELLQAAMDARGIPFAVQNRLLARFAPMHRDIVNKR